MRTTTFEFKNASGETLRGLLHHAPGPAQAVAVFAHCFTCTAKSKAATVISANLANHGITTLRFDFTGLGDSEGAFSDTNFSTSVSDLLAAVAALEQHSHRDVELLIGHSLGGTAVLSAALQLPQVKAVATIGAPSRADHVSKLLAAGQPADMNISADESIEVSIGGQPFKIKRQLFDDLEAQPMPDQLRQLRSALLVMHAPLDAIVEIENASEIFLNALHPKSFVSLDSADHLLTNRDDAAYAAQLIAAWAKRYLSAPAQVAETGITAETGRTGFTTPVTIGRHTIISDEPASVGGANLGPSPVQLVSGALAACTTMTLQMYARHKGLQLERVSVQVEHTKIDDPAGPKGKGDLFKRELTLEGDLDDPQRKRLGEIADRCPVHQILSHAAKVTTKLN